MEALHREKALLGHYATVRRGSIAFTLLPSTVENLEKNIQMVDFQKFKFIFNHLKTSIFAIFDKKLQLYSDGRFYL